MTDQYGGDPYGSSATDGASHPDDPYRAGVPGYSGPTGYPYGPGGSGYAGPPPTAHPYGAADPYAAPAYAYPPPFAAYPPPMYAYAYAPKPPGELRPGTTTAAAVLGYVEAGLLILAGLILFSGSQIADDLNGSHSAEFATDGALNLLAAGLMIAGAVLFTARNAVGRILYSAGSAMVLGLTVYWLTRWHDDLTNSGLLFWGGLFATLMIVGTALLWAPDGTRWLAGAPKNSTAPGR